MNAGDLTARLAALTAQYGIPGAGVALWHDGQLTEVSTGLANVRTGVEVDRDTLFLIGSITKTMTTGLIMQLVDEGVLALDAPVVSYLPDLQLGTPEATETVTVRQLVTHTNGIPGDYLADFGRGDDAVERYVHSFREIGQLHAPGAMISYSNAAFGLAGHLVARVTGQRWDDALRDRLLRPLGMEHTVTLAEDAINHRVAVAHVRQADGSIDLGEMWQEFRAGGPAGFTPRATPRDLIAWARLHMNEGRAADGRQVLSPESVAAMQTVQFGPFASGHWDALGIGLGFFIYDWSGLKVIGHVGGRSACLRAIPERDFAVAVLTNTHGGAEMADELIDEIVGELFGASLAEAPPADAEVALDPARYVGSYQHVGSRLRIAPDGAGIKLVAEALWSIEPGTEATLEPVSETVFRLAFGGGDAFKVSFLEPDAEGRFGYFHSALRAFKRVD